MISSLKTEGYLQFEGSQYKVREVDLGKGWGRCAIASMQLESTLLGEQNRYVSEEARLVDENIFFFIPTHWFKLSDDQLRCRILMEVE